MEWIYVFVGGGLGSLCRYGVARLAMRWEVNLPLGTILANVIACFLLGLLMGWMTRHPEQRALQLLLAVGFCGGFSTFSTFSLENVQLWQNGAYTTAMLNVLLSVVLCFGSVLAGMKLMSS